MGSVQCMGHGGCHLIFGTQQRTMSGEQRLRACSSCMGFPGACASAPLPSGFLLCSFWSSITSSARRCAACTRVSCRERRHFSSNGCRRRRMETGLHKAKAHLFQGSKIPEALQHLNGCASSSIQRSQGFLQQKQHGGCKQSIVRTRWLAFRAFTSWLGASIVCKHDK